MSRRIHCHRNPFCDRHGVWPVFAAGEASSNLPELHRRWLAGQPWQRWLRAARPLPRLEEPGRSSGGGFGLTAGQLMGAVLQPCAATGR